MEYKSKLGLLDTEIAIKKVKDFFEKELSLELSLIRVSAPIFVRPESGLNDNLNGIERPVSFDVKAGDIAEIVHSLAKWKRMALYRYGIETYNGLYTDMNAIRRDEDPDAIHSYYVDQWDWEKIIKKEDRNIETLKHVVEGVYSALRKTERYLRTQYPTLSKNYRKRLLLSQHKNWKINIRILLQKKESMP
ncbi:aspartate-ammonia ligase [Fusobacterium necrophorum subsp. funduliforme 1_1_36S]|nr:aspartate-ammonia ligase [Fusobacterium necrophorum subsp. funduliforme 1_1_36S]